MSIQITFQSLSREAPCEYCPDRTPPNPATCELVLREKIIPSCGDEKCKKIAATEAYLLGYDLKGYDIFKHS